MRINNNIAASNSLNKMTNHNNKVSKRMDRLSSGLRINRAADDAAGLSISEGMRSQIRGLEQASLNAQDGISLMQTAEGALHETHEMLQRQRELAVRGSNGSLSDEDRQAIQAELDQLTEEITRIAEETQFNGIPILAEDSTINIQIGANSGQILEIDLVGATADDLGLVDPLLRIEDLDIIDRIDGAINQLSNDRTRISGAVHNRLEHAVNNIHTMSMNLSEAESRIRDADMAHEMLEMTKATTLRDAAQAMLAQANQSAQSVVELLR